MTTVSDQTAFDPLVQLAHHRWSIPLVAELHRRAGAKHVTLLHGLGISRSMLGRSLQGLVALGLVTRNTGHGHPMRPEYLLTARGARLGPACGRLVAIIERRDESDLAFRKWTLPLVAAIGKDTRRFSEIGNALCQASPRALTLGLKSMFEHRWLRRTLIDDYPPSAGYELARPALQLLPHVLALSR